MSTAVPAVRQTARVGDARLTYLPDGHILLQADRMFLNADWDWSAHADLVDAQGLLIMSLGTFLIEIGGTRALVDLGLGPRRVDVGALSGGLMQGEMVGGGLLGQLAQVGLGPEQIDAVFITHLHDEHIGWLVDASSSTPALTFPGARHFVGAEEWTFAASPAGQASPAAATAQQLELLGRRVETLADGDEPIPGVAAMRTPGHTPGHLSFVVSSAGERAVVIGDVVHSPVEFMAPELEFIGDADRTLAQATRRRVLAELARPGTITAGGHFPDHALTRWDATVGRFEPVLSEA